ncbi:MAG: hypothetical protein RLZZ597_1983 [Cyanobacteriota bacterium]|jgi:hypothetical protein
MSIADLTYTAITTSTSSVSLEVEARVVPIAGGANVRVEHWVNLDATSEPQVETITVSQANLPVADAHYQVSIDGPTGAARVFSWFFDASETPTEDDVAAALAELINLHPDVMAVQGGTGVENTVVVTGVTPGTTGAFTCTVTCLSLSNGSAVSNAISRTTTTAASGSGKVRKLAQLTIAPDIDANRKFTVQATGISFFDGAASSTAVNTTSGSFTHPQTMDAIRTAQGE